MPDTAEEHVVFTMVKLPQTVHTAARIAAIHARQSLRQWLIETVSQRVAEHTHEVSHAADQRTV